ncbi:MAG: undecaprenyl-diphosphate phosphatase [Candidatus Pedobacter colombiensis]|uniref:Undecaprenyl-diphosphatase n=1 Tax=Candidatus Pedobacter colombiensis TaxID=3121371 RepID=A0AAJ6B694_9SPHI|nr:undecaprenyl-diphosphate phosphatase [Pedobacter sp.]WEK18649.1 MAG: undecaprenyl-diphosphate phosphatase [Pedobacter sp.]
MNYLQTLILAIIEGITEFLPVSSTGHMIIASSVMGITKDPFVKLFEVAVQLGAILSVVVFYWKRFFPLNHWKFYLKLVIACLPAAVLGLLLQKKIDILLESPVIVAVMLVLGGIVLLFIDKVFNKPTVESEPEITNKSAFIIGFWQCLAMVPGTSRSAASIIGGMQQKLTRSVAAEFSFFLAVPTMVGATALKLFKAYKETPEILKDKHNLVLLGVGNVVAFVIALLAIKFFIGYVQKYGFKLFGWYRIVFGLIFLVLYYQNIIQL